MSGVGMFGLGMTQVSPVSTNVCSRRHPVTSRTVSSDSRAPTSACRNSPSKNLASSPTVIPCCWTISFLPTPEEKAGNSMGPRAEPPTGFGRSRTMNRAPVSTAAFIASYIVQM